MRLQFAKPSVVSAFAPPPYSDIFVGFGDGRHALGHDPSTNITWGSSDGGLTWAAALVPRVGSAVKCVEPDLGKGACESAGGDGFVYYFNHRVGSPFSRCGELATCTCCRCPASQANSSACARPTPSRSVVGINTAGGAVLSADGSSFHDLGDVDQHWLGTRTPAGGGGAGGWGRGRTSFSSTYVNVFAPSQNGSFVATTRPTPARFVGLPQGATLFSAGQGSRAVRMADGTLVMSVLVHFNLPRGNPDPRLTNVSASIVAYRSSDGLEWRYAGTVVDAAAAPRSQEGANENDLALMADGVSLLCVFRLDAGDGSLPSGVASPYKPYSMAVSTDGGHTWSAAASLGRGVGCARPRLLRVGASLLLAGGRANASNQDVFVWLNEAGDGVDWRPHSLTYWHNRLEPDASRHFSPDVNVTASGGTLRESNSYTSLVRTGPTTGFVTYTRLPGQRRLSAVAFAMGFSLVS